MNAAPESDLFMLAAIGDTELMAAVRNGSSAGFTAALTRLIASLDELISAQLSQVVQHTCFKRLEASWRGLLMLSSQPVSRRRVKIKMLDFKWRAVASDLNTSFDIRQSVLYRKLYSNEFDTAGGMPFGLLIVDHNIAVDYRTENDYDDLYTLQLLAELGEVAMCPVVMGVDAFFFGDNPRRQLHDGNRVKRILESDDFRLWQQLRENSSARFLHLVLPEYLQRVPYRNYGAGFLFTEDSHYQFALWGNSAYLLAANVIAEFERISWFGFLRSYDHYGSCGAIIQRSVAAKVDISSEESAFWSEQGFIPLTSVYLSGQKGFFHNQSVWNTGDGALRISGMLQTNLMACRFGHYIKAQLRDRVGRYDTIDDSKRHLERWVKNYVSDVDYGDDSVMARYPLKSCDIHIEEVDTDASRYLCRIILQPQYQYEMMDARVTLSTTLNIGGTI